MSRDATSPAADLIRRIAEMERKGNSETEAYQDLFVTLMQHMEDMPTTEIAALVRRSPDLEEDEGYWAPIHALRARGDRETFEICRVWASRDDPLVREAAADVLGQLGAPDELPFAAESAPLIKTLLGDANMDVLASAVMAAGHLGLLTPEELAVYARHASNEVRFSAVHALMGKDDDVSTASLAALCGDVDRDVRNWAVFALGQQTDADTSAIREAMLKLLGEEDAEIRGEALIGLARRGDMRVLEPLKRELAAEFEGAWGIEAAGVLSDPSLIPALVALQKRLDPEDLDAFGSEIEEAIEACSGE